MTAWYEMPALLDRGTVAEALSANVWNRSAAAADLGCTAAQLKKAAEVYCIIPLKELEAGTAAELSLRRMLLREMFIEDGESAGEEHAGDEGHTGEEGHAGEDDAKRA